MTEKFEISRSQARKIAADCVAALDRQSAMLLQYHAYSQAEVRAAVLPRNAATRALIGRLQGVAPLLEMGPPYEPVLTATTVRSIGQVLVDQGYENEGRLITEALDRSDEAGAAAAAAGGFDDPSPGYRITDDPPVFIRVTGPEVRSGFGIVQKQ